MVQLLFSCESESRWPHKIRRLSSLELKTVAQQHPTYSPWLSESAQNLALPESWQNLDISPAERAKHLADAAFTAVFQMSRSEFDTLPEWLQGLSCLQPLSKKASFKGRTMALLPCRQGRLLVSCVIADEKHAKHVFITAKSISLFERCYCPAVGVRGSTVCFL